MPAKFSSKKSWREKLRKPQDVKRFDVPPSMVKSCGTGTMIIPRPIDVDALIRKVRSGKLVTVRLLREKLARDCEADVACPITTGIFVRIASEAAEEDRANGRARITPYWRVIKDDGSLNPKFPGGVNAQAWRLRAEGFQIVAGKGKKPPKVADFEKSLAVFE